MKNKLLFIILLCSITASAQLNFSGSLVDDKTNAPISLGEIYLANDKTELSNLTDENGKFTFDQIPTGIYEMAVLVNFDTIYKEKIELTQNTEKQLKISSPNVDLKEVVIAKKVFQKKADRFVFDVSNSSIAKGNNAFNLLKQTPLVSSTDGKNLKILNKSDVIIYINGRKSNMDNEAIIEMLKNTPSENIQKIEIITVPGSEFQVEANTGVINIVMKKTTTNGYNGNVRLVDNQGYYNNPSMNASFNFRKDKLAVNTGVYTGINKSYEKIELSNGNKNFITNSNGYIADPNTNIGGNIGLDYELSANQNIGLTYNYRYNKSFNSIFTFDNSYNGILMNRTTKVEDAQTRNHSLNLNYEIKTDTIGSKLMTNASVLFYKRGMESTNQTFPFDNSEYQSLRQIIPQKINNISLNADYIAKTKKENTWLFGANYIYTKTDNDTKQDNLINGNYIPDQVFTNHFLYKENIIGLYLTFERKLSEKLSGKIGSRLEITKTEGDIIGKNNSFKNDYTNLLPYLTLNYEINKNNNLSYTFSSRIKRPAFWELNPARTYMTPTNYLQNNPFMSSSKYYKQELNYLLKGAYFLNVDFEYVEDASGQIPLQGSVKNLATGETTEFLRYIRMNYGDKKTLNATIGVNKALYNGIWNISYSSTFMYQKYSGVVKSDPTYIPQPGLEETLYPYIVDAASTSAHFKFDNNIRLSANKDWFLGVNYWYLSSFELELGKLGQQHSFDLNLKKIWTNWTVLFEVENLFDTANVQINNNESNGNFNNVYQKNYNRQFTLSITYKFGNQKIKKSRDINEANSTIKSRL